MSERTKLTDQNSIEQVLRELTLDEKLNLAGQFTALSTLAIEDMDIPSISLVDGVTGVNGGQISIDYGTNPANAEKNGRPAGMGFFSKFSHLYTTDLEAAREENQQNEFALGLIDHIAHFRNNGKDFISFPSGVNVGASFSTKTAEKNGYALGLEARDSHIDICLGPNVDIARDPLGGRNYEMYGEDPCLVEETSAAFITGMQNAGTAACAKHFIANNQETNRNQKDVHVSIRTLRELYSRGFMSAVDAGVQSVMCAYNAINGTFSAYNKMLLTDWLRKEWGFSGLMVTDWGAAAEDKTGALEAGIDLILCGPNDMTQTKQDVLEGRFSMETLDIRVRHILETILQVKKNHEIPVPEYNADALLQTAYDCIVDGAVLLKNNGVFPLSLDARPAFYGSGSKEMLECGSGSTAVPTRLHSSVYYSYLELAHVSSAPYQTMADADTLIYTAVAPAGENMDRDTMDLCPEDRGQIASVLKEAKEKGLKTIVILNVAGPVDVTRWEPYADAILCIFIPGCMGGKAAVDMLFGNAIPAGRLPVTFPKHACDTPSYPNFPGEFYDVYYGEGIFVGYKSYDVRNLDVSYPFGYGLTLTSFQDTLLQTSFSLAADSEDMISVPVKIQNTGSCSGSEVIQIYAQENAPHVLRPARELVGYGKVTLAPGEEEVLSIPIKKKALRYFDDKLGRWVTPVGEITLFVGTSSRDFFAKAVLTLTGENAYSLNLDSSIYDVCSNPESFALLKEFLAGFGMDLTSPESLQLMYQFSLRGYLAPFVIQTYPDSVEATAVLDAFEQKLSSFTSASV